MQPVSLKARKERGSDLHPLQWSVRSLIPVGLACVDLVSHRLEELGQVSLRGLLSYQCTRLIDFVLSVAQELHSNFWAKVRTQKPVTGRYRFNDRQ